MAKSAKNSRTMTVAIFLLLGVWALVAGSYLARCRERPVDFDAGPDVMPGDTATWEKERWVGIYQGREKIGYGVSRLRRVEDGYQVSYKLRIKVRLGNERQDISINLAARLDPGSHLRDFRLEADSGGISIQTRGRMEGNDLALIVDTGGEEQKNRLHYSKPLYLDTEWEIENKLRDPSPGREVSYTTFDPIFNTEKPVTIKVLDLESVKIGDREIMAWKAEVTSKAHTRWIWIDREQGQLIKDYDPLLGYTQLLEGKDEAVKVDWEKAGSVDLLSSYMVPASTLLIKPREIVYFRARLTDASLDGLDLESPGRQSFADGVVAVTSEEAIPAVGYGLPIKESLPERAAEFKAALEATPFIQSDNGKIIEAAKQALGGATDAVTAVDRLLEWVAGEVRDSYVFTIPSALGVLEQKRGACKEHTVLFVALARAAGIPARPVSGIVYSETMVVEGFYYHAWAEVYLADPAGDGAWVAVDPTFNQNPADATHIQLIEGDFGEMIGLTQVMGKLKVKVEEYR